FHSLLSSTCLHSPSSSTLSTLSLHDALPIYRPHLPREPARRGVARRSAGPARRPADRTRRGGGAGPLARTAAVRLRPLPAALLLDRKSTRLNSSHVSISYAVFCWKTKIIKIK